MPENITVKMQGSHSYATKRNGREENSGEQKSMMKCPHCSTIFSSLLPTDRCPSCGKGLGNEKKLTDEEIVKALENCNNGYADMNRYSCDTCPYREIDPCGKAQMTDCLDLIHCLQSENEKLLKDYYAERQTCDEQKAEIEQLQQTIIGYVADQEVWTNGYHSTQKENEMLKAEIERLTGEKNDWKQRYDSESNRYADLCNASSECIQKKNDRIAELQKQVDELKFDKEILQNIIKRNEEYQQGTKDTAKKIFTGIKESFVFAYIGASEDYEKGYNDALSDYDKQLADFAKDEYGVEVGR